MRISARAAVALAAAALAACPAPRAVRPPPVPLEAAAHHDEPALAGVVHVVRRGETVWRIARAYGIDPADLMETNGITDPRTVEVGTELFVPGADRVVDVPPLGADLPSAPPSPTAAQNPTPTPTSSSTPTPTPTPTSNTGPIHSSPLAHPAPSPALRGGEGRGEGGEGPRTVAASPARSEAATPARTTALAWPLKGVLYGRYGVRDGRRHDGIDIAAPEGSPVLAAAAGTVIYTGEQAGYGAVVIVRHDGGLVTLYAHNSTLLVDEGRRVRRGEPIARVGQTGRTSGPHLHFEVREGTRPKNPLLYLP